MTPKALKSLRIAVGCSIRDFAFRLRIPEETLRRWERGDEPIDLGVLTVGLECLWPPTMHPPRTRLSAGHS